VSCRSEFRYTLLARRAPGAGLAIRKFSKLVK
jgi:hypothetical protein